MSSSPIVKCSQCNQILSNEDFDKHQCNLSFNKGVKRIPVVYFRDDSYDDQKIIRGYGTDGTVYTLVVTQRTAIPFVLSSSDEFLQRKNTRRRLDRTFNRARGSVRRALSHGTVSLLTVVG